MKIRADGCTVTLISACLLGVWVPGLLAQDTGRPTIAPPGPGIIRGVVVDENGKPVEEAEVRPLPVHGISKRWTFTDKDGRFEMGDLLVDEYIVFASKPLEAYPDQTGKIYHSGVDVRVVLTDANPIGEVKVVLGPKAGILKPVVTDAVTGQPVTWTFRMWDWTDPDDFIAGVMDPLLVPSNRRVGLQIGAEGYLLWRYAPYPDSDEAGPLTMKPGEVRALKIKLQPEPKP